ncbi:hypothetical protein FOMPIDRAFT_1021008, partial [Fomitopsis schrenkii]
MSRPKDYSHLRYHLRRKQPQDASVFHAVHIQHLHCSDESILSGSDKSAHEVKQSTDTLRALSFVSQYGAEWIVTLTGRVRNILTDKRAVDYNITRAPAPKSATVWYQITSDTFIEHLAAKTDPGRALRFWIVGEVAHDGAGLIEVEEATLHSAPASYDDGTLSASSSMLYRSKGETTATPAIFTSCYDATAAFTSYCAMGKYTASLIGVNDLVVVVEARPTKWKCDGKGKARYKGDWEPYR